MMLVKMLSKNLDKNPHAKITKRLLKASAGARNILQEDWKAEGYVHAHINVSIPHRDSSVGCANIP